MNFEILAARTQNRKTKNNNTVDNSDNPNTAVCRAVRRTLSER